MEPLRRVRGRRLPETQSLPLERISSGIGLQYTFQVRLDLSFQLMQQQDPGVPSPQHLLPRAKHSL